LSRREIRLHVGSDNYHGGTIDHGAGQVHPMKLAAGLAVAAETAGAMVHERSEVLRVEPGRGAGGQRVITASGSVRCNTVVYAANGYLDKLCPPVNKWVMPINNFIIVTEPLGTRADALLPHDDAVADSRFVVNYFRRVDSDRLLFGGGESYSYRFPRAIDKSVRRAMSVVFPQLAGVRIDYAWGGTLAITRNRLPYLQQLTPGAYAAGGYSGHGVALAVMYGTAIAEHIDGRADRFEQLAAVPAIAFPGGTAWRPALLAAAMTGYSWLDRL
jgi:gamma-glutamylputrescine oxidase